MITMHRTPEWRKRMLIEHEEYERNHQAFLRDVAAPYWQAIGEAVAFMVAMGGLEVNDAHPRPLGER